MADVNRLRIVRRLAQSEATVAELIAHVGLSASRSCRGTSAASGRPAWWRPGGRAAKRSVASATKRSTSSPPANAPSSAWPAEQMTISNESRGRIKKIFEPIALAMGRLGLTPERPDPHRLRRSPSSARSLVGRPALGHRRPRRLRRRRLRHVRRHPRPRDRQGEPVRRVHGLGLRPLAGEIVVFLGASPGSSLPDAGDVAVLVAAAALGAAFMVSYTRAKSDGLGFSSGIGHGRGRGHAPRDPARDRARSASILHRDELGSRPSSRPRHHPRRRRHHRHPADPPRPPPGQVGHTSHEPLEREHGDTP